MTEPTKIILASEEGISIQSLRDINDALSASFGSAGLILTERDVTPALFDLRSGLLGELFQKFTNYQIRLAIVLIASNTYGERFSELVYEHRTHNLIRFVNSEEEARAWLATTP